MSEHVESYGGAPTPPGIVPFPGRVRGESPVTAALWRRYREDRDLAARDRLLEQYLGLVHHAARQVARRVPAELDLDDLVGAGSLGLVQALESFDPSRGFAFSTYALPRIRGAILDEVRSWDWVPRSVRDRTRKLRRAEQSLRGRLGREPEPEEVADALEVDLDTYRRYANESRGPVLLSLDPAPDPGEDAPARLSDTLADAAAPDPDASLARAELLAGLADAFDSLSERERLILTLSYYEELTLKEIGEILHVTESRVSQLRTRALRRLQERMDPMENAA